MKKWKTKNFIHHHQVYWFISLFAGRIKTELNTYLKFGMSEAWKDWSEMYFTSDFTEMHLY